MTKLAGKNFVMLSFSNKKELEKYISENANQFIELYNVLNKSGVFRDSAIEFKKRLLDIFEKPWWGRIKQDLRLFLLYKEDKIISVAQGTYHGLTFRHFALERVGMLPEYQDQKIGFDFITKIIIELRKSGYHNFDMLVSADGATHKINKKLEERFNVINLKVDNGIISDGRYNCIKVKPRRNIK